MKRFLAVIGMITSMLTTFDGVHDFDNAHTGIALFKGAFWMVVGIIAFWSFMEDFKENRWFWEF